VYITPETKSSNWVNWEIEYAEKKGKRIVGVYAQGANECDVPEALEKYADDVRGWQSDGIVDAILGKSNEWRSPAGELRDPRPIKRFGC
jgi:Uri superfamily endonuclease